MQNRPAIEIINLTKRYKKRINPTLDGLSISIPYGSLFGILAPNGAGKTTTIDIVCGLKKCTSGDVFVGGYSVKEDMKKIKTLIGLVPQDIALFSALTGRENLTVIGGMYGIEKRELRSRIEMLMEQFGLSNSANKLISEYSGGMKRRINLIAGLLHNPQILILDEPTVGVDAQSRNLILEELIKINKKGTTILFISHYLEEAECICDTVAMMDGGRIVLQGNPHVLTDSEPGCKNLEALYFKLTGKQMRDSYE